jgi:hypothetical protein
LWYWNSGPLLWATPPLPPLFFLTYKHGL